MPGTLPTSHHPLQVNRSEALAGVPVGVTVSVGNAVVVAGMSVRVTGTVVDVGVLVGAIRVTVGLTEGRNCWFRATRGSKTCQREDPTMLGVPVTVGVAGPGVIVLVDRAVGLTVVGVGLGSTGVAVPVGVAVGNSSPG